MANQAAKRIFNVFMGDFKKTGLPLKGAPRVRFLLSQVRAY
jgi:hypothetical protein